MNLIKNRADLWWTLFTLGLVVIVQLIFCIVIGLSVGEINQYLQDPEKGGRLIKNTGDLWWTLFTLGLVVIVQLIFCIVIGLSVGEINQYMCSQKMIKRTEFLRLLLQENAETVKKVATLMGIKIVLGEKTNVARILIPKSIIGIKDHKVLGKFLGSVIKVFSVSLDYQTLVRDLKECFSIAEIKEISEAIKERHPAISENLKNAILKVESTLVKEEKQKKVTTRQRSKKEGLRQGLKVWGISPKSLADV